MPACVYTAEQGSRKGQVCLKPTFKGYRCETHKECGKEGSKLVLQDLESRGFSRDIQAIIYQMSRREFDPNKPLKGFTRQIFAFVARGEHQSLRIDLGIFVKPLGCPVYYVDFETGADTPIIWWKQILGYSGEHNDEYYKPLLLLPTMEDAEQFRPIAENNLEMYQAWLEESDQEKRVPPPQLLSFPRE